MTGHSSPPSYAYQPAARRVAGGGAGTRVDEAHGNGLGRRGSESSPARWTNAGGDAAIEPLATPSAHAPLEDWLRLHAGDLISQLQQSAESLDARQSRLNAQIAMHERREREFRLWSESQRRELEELRDEAERLRSELKTAARRVALADESPPRSFGD